MIKVYEKLIIGTDQNCQTGSEDITVVHACKSPCHQRAVGYRGSLPNNHPNYLVLERDFDLYLNIIDPPAPLFMMPLFTEFLKFAGKHWNEGRTLLIHCNQGESRAPSLALLFLSKYLEKIPNESYESAKSEFQKMYSYYSPGRGIQLYLSKNWHSL